MRSIHKERKKGLRASYEVCELVAKVSKAHTIAEILVKPAILVCVKEMLGEEAATVLQKVPLSNDTVKRRQEEMAENLEEQPVIKLKVFKFSLQIDETALHNCLLLAHVRFIEELTIQEEMLFMKALTDTKSETIFEAVKSYFEEKEIPLSYLLQIATEGANAMTGRLNGFIAKLKEFPTSC
eukprot:XP_014783047.1 PREDICTED: SCAN domain-containing protein 3-like [Octopus bimaculoides]